MKQLQSPHWEFLCCIPRTAALLRVFLSGFDVRQLMVASFLLLLAGRADAQVNVLTAHNDIARTGQNLSETILTPSNVNSSQFGKLFSLAMDGQVLAQPLYVSQVSIPGKGVHNVLYVVTGGVGGRGDSAYAFDADSNGGADANPLWHVSLLTNTASANGLKVSSGVWGTPVIDLATGTMYLVSSELNGSASLFRLHALDITTGAEKFGGPIQIQASVPGAGTESVGGVLPFEPASQKQRPGLLFLNGVVYIGFGSNNDEGAWHGWIFSYAVNPATQTLRQLDVFCTTPNGTGGGIWMGGAALAAEVYSAQKPYGRLFFSTGNGTFSASAPFSYGMSVVDLDLTGGVMTLEDHFTPFNQATLNGEDGDLGSGGPFLLPTQTLASGKTLKPLFEVGKSGMFYILDRDNNTDGSNNQSTEYSPAGLGGYGTGADHVVQEVQTPIANGLKWGSGTWGTEAYWNNHIYFGGTNVSNTDVYVGTSSHLEAYSFVNGVLSATPTSESVEQFVYPSPTPSISANGNADGIVWVLITSAYETGGPETLLAYDATNLGSTLYSSATNQSRDNPGVAMKYALPTIANGKVYVGADGQLSVYGLLDIPQAPVPTISPSSGTFATPPTVTITDAIAGATIYYTTDGTTPTTASAVYNNSFNASANETITAIASANGYLTSSPTSATYLSANIPASPVFSLAPGTYTGTQTLTITDATPGAVIHYTTDGPLPTANSQVYSQPITLFGPLVAQALATSPGGYSSPVVSATYNVQPTGTIDFSQGFTLADGPITFNGSTGLDDFRLQLTDGGANEAGTAFYATPVNIQQFTTQFTFQLSNPAADGITFTIQNSGANALGGPGGSLGYAGIPQSIALKFDLFNNAGEGPDSTGLYTNGAMPTVPSINLTGTGIDLHSQDYFNVTLTYDGTNLTMTITDAVTLATWSRSFVVNIPAIVGGNTAYVGFTGGTGGLSSSQKLTSWVYLPGPPMPNYSAGFTPASLTLNGGATINGASLELTDGNLAEKRSAFFNLPVNVSKFSSSFEFQLTNANADGFTFTIQGNNPTAMGAQGSNGGLGYQGMPLSVAVKFDIFNDQGEGPDSTGLYINGASPTVPAINLAPKGINLHSGDPFNVQMTYDGKNFMVMILDTVTQATEVQTYVVNIPSIVGGTTAYVGFTASSGGLGAVQEILNWSYAPFSTN